MSKSWSKGSTRGWRRVRAQVLARDGYRCQLRLPGKCTSVATCAHHTKGKGVTGDDPRYLVAACDPCNLAVGDPTRRTDPPAQPVTRW